MSPFLNNGDIIASLQSDGSEPELSDNLKIAVRPGASSAAHSLSTVLGMQSGPAALLMLILPMKTSSQRLSSVLRHL